MEYLNLIPLAILAYVFLRAIQTGLLVRDPTDRYFTVNKIKTGRKFSNWFGVPKN